ncbi:2-succinyl-5-enolpyruvyl-6-hydroxy-3-cyclohexene-1-carboxylic-acid synthase [Flavobacterium sp.]|jgi:2-succinyl-5-enolpyruvyl-6-hydroxy-3-cyclohexene-1-carboxylate synthase|uniref:2-succinyl-5-enolpyruvyl-6-hydroxy-3- cyclohexene-1-carboxylic-acid synthase n=1 Tax=Flavobacterium sp. TaxID=239 RepID=UPI002A7F536B|nr:2-succinyl-5-enolpyruvyl-6-hydroxy-3-cyclohexene-1-carboxylic-acid synthase [Flavobacterium sp.]
MIYPEIPLAQSVIEICKAKGVEHIIISPGSRNAPLTIGFANHPSFKCYSIVDERCAAFFALGIAQQINKPVAVVCTSGSALLNYYPAVAEAFYSQIPLVIISADRPHDKIDIGDGQTIRQENVFTNHILYNANLHEIASIENDLTINEALNTSITNKGPVHINVPFEEPLYSTVSELSVTSKVVPIVEENKTLELNNDFVSKWNLASKKLVLVGELKPNSIETFVAEQLAKDESVVVMTEATSNLHNKTFVSNIDAIITPFTTEDFEHFKPEILVTFGGMVVSKRIKAFLRKYQPIQHWHIDELRAYDTYGCLTNHVKSNPNLFFNQLYLNCNLVSSTYAKEFADIITFREQKHKEYLATVPFSDFSVFELITKKLQGNINLQISNSSAIRYMQLFDLNENIEVFCNRGTSGIDGSTSTAIGAATTSEKLTVLITGDISFFYDSNALWNKYIPNNFKIILINNSGGGIFRILPGHQENNVFNEFFETSHNLKANHLAEMYGFKYCYVNENDDLENLLDKFLNSNECPSLLEINTPEKLNNQVLLNYFKKL